MSSDHDRKCDGMTGCTATCLPESPSILTMGATLAGPTRGGAPLAAGTATMCSEQLCLSDAA